MEERTRLQEARRTLEAAEARRRRAWWTWLSAPSHDIVAAKRALERAEDDLRDARERYERAVRETSGED